MLVRRQIEISGIVQGVGFRPYIYKLATETQLAGTIRNTSSGVTIEVQGPPSAVDDFISRLPRETPPLARITDIVTSNLPCNGDREFRIIASHAEETVRALISPDVATCADCLREVFDPDNRRYRYAFTNCTNCGPRFTIVHGIPYDRRHTSMAVFKMCAACQKEYDNPLDRRFHAQPNACRECGPHLELWGNQGGKLESSDPISDTIDLLRTGKIVAIKGLGGFHLAVDATNRAAVALLRERKRRVGKPFAIMVRNLVGAQKICETSAAEAVALQSIQRPIVLLRRRTRANQTGPRIADEVAPGNKYLGVFLAYTPLHHLLLIEGKFTALVMTSGNLTEEPIAIANDEARVRLGKLADCFLIHNREILLRCDDSVVRVLPDAFANFAPVSRSLETKAFNHRGRESFARRGEKTQVSAGEKVQQLRRSRGFVPVPVFLGEEIPSILAVGGELKNTICLTKGKHAFLSQHVGDLENLESYKFFEEATNHLRNVLEIRPEIVAYDLHPDYFSTRWALEKSGMPLIGVQHHHAHIASCMAENHLHGQVIGIALDGTGYGKDGKIWGGEVLVAGYKDFERAAHFGYVQLPGGALAIHEPWRMAVSYLVRHFGRDFLQMKLPFLEDIDRSKVELLLQAIERKINSPLTSSCGRLFDAVAALTGIRQQVTYEAQAAIELEMAAGDSLSDDAYEFELLQRADGLVIGTRKMFEMLVEDILARRHRAGISRKFHNGLVNILTEIAQSLRQQHSLDRVCLSGGTFNNLCLTTGLKSRLRLAGFEVFMQHEVPAGDGGLSLGQAMVAAHQANL
jgi:hydrogenase maturation protein HypF